MELKETRVSRQCVYDGRLLHVYSDTVRLPNGRTAGREVLEHQGAVCVVPLDRNGCVTLVRQFRYAVGREVLEIPAGKIDAGEEPFAAAVRELSEETGQEAGSWTDLGEYLPTPGYSGEVLRCYLATELTEGEAHTDPDEFLQTETMSLKEAVALVMDGTISDGKSAFALLKAARLLGI